MLPTQAAFLLVLAAGCALHCRAQDKIYIGTLPQGGILNEGDRLYSLNRSSTELGEVYLTMQPDGNVVLYLTPAVDLIGPVADAALFATNTVGAGSGPPYTLHMQTDGNLVLYDGTGHPLFYSTTFQSAVTQPGAKLALVVDDMALSGKLYNYAEPIYRATFCVTTANQTCYQAGYIGQQSETYFRPPNYVADSSSEPSQIGSIVDINFNVAERENDFLDIIKEGVRLYSDSGKAFLLGQHDGNLVLYDTVKASKVGLNGASAIWASGTYGQVDTNYPENCCPPYPCEISVSSCSVYLLCGVGYTEPGTVLVPYPPSIVYQSPAPTGTEGPCFLSVEDTNIQIHDVTGKTIFCAPAGDPGCNTSG